MLTAIREGLSWFFAATVLFVALVITMGSEAMAAEAGDDITVLDASTNAEFSDDIFQIGGSCAGLAYLNGSEIQHLLSNAFSDEHHSFCYPEEPSDCTDYTSFMKGLGRMTTGDDGYHCAVQLTL